MNHASFLTCVSSGIVVLRATLPAASAGVAAWVATHAGLDPAASLAAGAAAGAGVNGVLDSAHSVATNLLSTRLDRWADAEPSEIVRLFAGDTLTRIVAQGIMATLDELRKNGVESGGVTYKGGEFEGQLKALLPQVADYWQKEWPKLTQGELAAAHAGELSAILQRQIQGTTDTGLATKEAWEEFLHGLIAAKGLTLDEEFLKVAAGCLRDRLARDIHKLVEHANAEDPQAWAAMHLQFQSRILKAVTDGSEEQTKQLARLHVQLLVLGTGVAEIKEISLESIGILQRLDGAVGWMLGLAVSGDQRGQRIEEVLRQILDQLQSDPPLRPPIVRLLKTSAPAAEFVRLMDALLVLEAKAQGCEIGQTGTHEAGSIGFTTHTTKGRFCGMDPLVRITVDTWDRLGSFGLEFMAGSDRLIVDRSVKHWVFITHEKRTSSGWEMTVQSLARHGIAAHNFSQPEFEPWLRRCPALLARYYPQEAAKRSDAQGFDGREFEGWQREFSAKVLADHRALQLFGFPRSRRHGAEPEQAVDPTSFLLEQVFIPQRLVPRGETEAAARTAGQLIQGDGCCVLLGDPGAGKTSLLRYLAVAGGEGRDVGGVKCPRRVPFFLPLREFARHQAERPTLLAALAHHARVSVSLSAEAVHRWHLEGLLMMGEAMVFFDGLDEAGDPATRRDVARFILQFRQDYPACPVWVTSRIVGYDQAALDKEVFPHFEVTPFDPGQQSAFVQQWYLAKLPQPEAATKRDDKTRAFLQSLDRAVPEIKELAGNPLLLTLAIWVHDELGSLPTGRGQLYDQCVEILVHKRDAERFDGEKIALEKLEPPLKPDNLRRYYTHIALKAQEVNAGKAKEERGVILKADLLRWIKVLRLPELRRFHNASDGYEKAAEAQAQAILDHSEERCGLLRYRGADTYAFLHLTFQEHLAAERKAAVLASKHGELTEFIVSHAGIDAWRETLLLLLYHLRKDQVRGAADDESETPFSDWLIARLQTPGKSAPAPACQRLLGMALRDGIEFTPAHRRWILELLLQDWRTQPEFDTETFRVLSQVADFSPESRPMLLHLLQEGWQDKAGMDALLTLHLRVRLLGWPTEGAEAGRLAGELQGRLAGAVVLGHRGGLESPPARERGLSSPPLAALPILQRAAELLADAGPDTVAATAEGAECVAQVRARLQELMWSPQLAIKGRAAAGVALSRVGDPRPGVGCRPASGSAPSLPDLEFVAVAGGEFVMGSELGEGHGDERPQMPRCGLVPRAFRLSRYPVTVAQFAAFISAGGYGQAGGPRPDWWTDTGWRWRVAGKIEGPADHDAVYQTPNHPRVGVSWFEAHAFARWLHGHRVALGVPEAWEIRLPWEAEWERAARGFGGRKYPWGTEDPDGRCNYAGQIGHTSAVGLFPVGDALEGTGRLCDLSGNVWEWCATKWRENYEDYGRLVDNQTEGEDGRVLRGGSWILSDVLVRGSYRGSGDPWYRGLNVGFRVAASPISGI